MWFQIPCSQWHLLLRLVSRSGLVCWAWPFYRREWISQLQNQALYQCSPRKSLQILLTHLNLWFLSNEECRIEPHLYYLWMCIVLSSDKADKSSLFLNHKWCFLGLITLKLNMCSQIFTESLNAFILITDSHFVPPKPQHQEGEILPVSHGDIFTFCLSVFHWDSAWVSSSCWWSLIHGCKPLLLLPFL